MLFILNLHLKCRFFFACANNFSIYLHMSEFITTFAAAKVLLPITSSLPDVKQKDKLKSSTTCRNE